VEIVFVVVIPSDNIMGKNSKGMQSGNSVCCCHSQCDNIMGKNSKGMQSEKNAIGLVWELGGPNPGKESPQGDLICIMFPWLAFPPLIPFPAAVWKPGDLVEGGGGISGLSIT
jgi:hypothetical protein